jgi:hypothetical protein
MDNRDKNKKMDRNTSPDQGSDVNRSKSSDLGKQKGDSSADFGQNIGRSEGLDNEPSRRGNQSNDSFNKNKDSGRGSSQGGGISEH